MARYRGNIHLCRIGGRQYRDTRNGKNVKLRSPNAIGARIVRDRSENQPPFTGSRREVD
jgi:hypothetical protein